MNSPDYRERRRANDPVLQQIEDDLAKIREDYINHVRNEDDRSFAAMLRRNWLAVVSMVFALLVQGVTVSWWLSNLIGDLRQRQEISNLKVGVLEERVREWYSKADATRDFLLRDQRDADLQRRIELLEQESRDRRR